MLFNSTEYLVLFLPVTLFIYFWITGRWFPLVGKIFLCAASLFFYTWWAQQDLLLLLATVSANFVVGRRLANFGSTHAPGVRILLVSAIFANIAVLAYYKYATFFLSNLSLLIGDSIQIETIALPLAISFFTFTQIAYLVDSYRGQAREYTFANYLLFVTFFPHLIAGPILHHAEMMPQFESRRNLAVRYSNVALGLLLISIGLFKKVIIADHFSQWASAGFDNDATLDLTAAWATSLSYTFQLYFDFSGYTDMALGSALLFNIRLPINFNSPYKARNIQDFWRRWHITLSRFLRDYLYVPMGGNRRGRTRVLANLMITFVLGGLWHGASWMFVIWGALHGAAMVAHRAWAQLGIALPRWLAWLITFNFVNLAWVFFRARDLADARRVLGGMVGINGVVLPAGLGDWLPHVKSLGVSVAPTIRVGGAGVEAVLWLFAAFVIVLGFRNSNQFAPFTREGRTIGPGWAITCGLMTSVSVVGILASKYSEFIYFNF